MQQRPVLRVVERGAAGDPEQVEQALRPEHAAVAHAPQPGAAAGHALQPVQPPLRGERAQRVGLLAVAVGLVENDVERPRRVERVTGDVPPTGTAGRRGPPHRGGAGARQHGGDPVEHVVQHGAVGLDELAGGGVAALHRAVAHDEQRDARLRRDLVPGHGGAIVAPGPDVARPVPLDRVMGRARSAVAPGRWRAPGTTRSPASCPSAPRRRRRAPWWRCRCRYCAWPAPAGRGSTRGRCGRR
jgi:hypothetical protein